MGDIKQCDGCKGIQKEVKGCIASCLHEHPTASKVQKRIFAQVTFLDVESGSKMELCEACQNKVIQGMAHGGNWE